MPFITLAEREKISLFIIKIDGEGCENCAITATSAVFISVVTLSTN